MDGKLVIKSTAHIGRLELFDLSPSNPSKPIDHLSVRLIDENLEAAAQVYTFLAPDLVGFFEGLAGDWRGWDGAREWRSLEEELIIRCTHDGLGHIAIHVYLRSGSGSRHRDWEVETIVMTEAGQLDRIVSDARAFFAGRSFAA